MSSDTEDSWAREIELEESSRDGLQSEHDDPRNASVVRSGSSSKLFAIIGVLFMTTAGTAGGIVGGWIPCPAGLCTFAASGAISRETAGSSLRGASPNGDDEAYAGHDASADTTHVAGVIAAARDAYASPTSYPGTTSSAKTSATHSEALSNVEFDPQRWPGEGGSNAPRVVDAEPISESRANAQATLASAASASDDPYADDVTATTAATPSAAEALGGRGDADSVAVTDAAESNTEDAVLAPRAGRTAADESAQEKTAKRYEQSKSASDIEPVAGGGQDARDDAQTGQAAAIEKDASALERIETLESQLVADAEKARGNPAAAAKLADAKANVQAAKKKISAQLEADVLAVDAADANNIGKAG